VYTHDTFICAYKNFLTERMIYKTRIKVIKKNMVNYPTRLTEKAQLLNLIHMYTSLEKNNENYN